MIPYEVVITRKLREGMTCKNLTMTFELGRISTRRQDRGKSEAARQITSQARLFDVQCDKYYAFARWGPLLAAVDPVGSSEKAAAVPAFRLGGPGSDCLDAGQVMRVVKMVAQDVVPDWNRFDYGGHSFKIGRNNDLGATGVATEEQRNRMTMHTQSSGKKPYDRADAEAELKLFRAAESVHYTPIETIDSFPSARNEPRPSHYGAKVVEGVAPELETADKALQNLLETGKRVECGAEAVELGGQEDGGFDELRAEIEVEAQREQPKLFTFHTELSSEAQQLQKILHMAPRQKVKKAEGSLCEECNKISRNYGLKLEGKARWCRRCSLKHKGACLITEAKSTQHTKAVSELRAARASAARFFGGRSPSERKRGAATWLRQMAEGLQPVAATTAWTDEWIDMVQHCAMKRGRAATNMLVYTSSAALKAQLQAIGPLSAARLLELSCCRIEDARVLQPTDRSWVQETVAAALKQCQGAGPKAALRSLRWLADEV
eukprot:SAG11_NODE_36_length_21869_cov_38.038999_6_plen_492_part_00